LVGYGDDLALVFMHFLHHTTRRRHHSHLLSACRPGPSGRNICRADSGGDGMRKRTVTVSNKGAADIAKLPNLLKR
jgi:hypothetical protein